MYIAIDKLPNRTMYGFDIKALNYAKRDGEEGFIDVSLCQEIKNHWHRGHIRKNKHISGMMLG